MSESLPIDHLLPEIRSVLRDNRALILEAPPGAGKTTRVPLALLGEPWLNGGNILVLEPRRLAARAAARRMAEQLGEAVGETVGYSIRFERHVSSNTRIEVVTEGILARRIQSDPELSGVSLVIFDEFHERHLESDLALALCADIANALRDDLRLLVMSATLDGDGVARLLGAPALRSEGRSHPVAVHYLSREPGGTVSQAVADAVRRAVQSEKGDILAFLPGAGEIRRTAEFLRADPGLSGSRIHELYGNLSAEAQQAAISPDSGGRRKVVLSTNIAETSLTIEGVTVVVDSGWMRVPRFDPDSGLTRLKTVRVSRASAAQRAGRAGRTAPGVCYRLWTGKTQRGLIPHHVPEIQSADLAGFALELARWGVRDPGELNWLDPPPPGAWAQAQELLSALGALDAEGRITADGQAMAELPIHPRLAHMLHRAARLGAAGHACDVAALLEERDVLHPEHQDCELQTRLEALERFRRDGRSGALVLGADATVCARVDRASKQFRRVLKESAGPEATRPGVGLLLALAYPDRIAQPRNGHGNRYLLSGGRGARLPVECTVAGRWLAVATLHDAGSESLIRTAAPVDPDALASLMPEHVKSTETVQWDAKSEAVEAVQQEHFGALLLSSISLGHADPDAIVMAMLEGVRRMGLDVLPWSEDARRLQARVTFLGRHFPELGCPDLSDSALQRSLEEWLAPFLGGLRRRSQLGRLNMLAILQSRLDWSVQQKLEQGAPDRILLPSGRMARLDYSNSDSPVLAVKLQEMFGEPETPTVGWGKIPLTLHLLSPAQRPIQVTRDLRGFWQRTYPEVKKELKGRYPKHPWPDDPWSERPTAGIKRRR